MAIQERDEALKDVVATVAGALNGLRGRGENRGTNLSRLADGFESLFSIQDAAELRRQLRENVGALRQSVEEMRREGEASVRLLESQVHAFEQRLEAARKGAGKDRLTGLGSRREAERQMQRHIGTKSLFCVLVFDIEGFREINTRYGTSFGDKLLQALSHTLKARFPEEGTLFRWGPDEFLAVAEGPIAPKTDLCRSVCAMFAGNRYSTFEGAARASVSATLAAGVAQHVAGETVNDLYRRARANLDQSRAGYRR
jgi:diguanylate cyclase (GGDEF)-like protein